MKIKVCGLKEAENIKAVSGLRPDYMGFICYPLSPRYISQPPLQAMANLPASIYKTGVFVNDTAVNINQLIAACSFNAIQLHGNESPAFSDSFRDKVKVIKAFGIDDHFNFNELSDYENHVDFFLFDTKTSLYGGSGKTFNWSILDNYKLNVPFFLSGGINIDNIAELKNITHPQFYGVDLNSRFETEPGVKDLDKLEQAFHSIKK